MVVLRRELASTGAENLFVQGGNGFLRLDPHEGILVRSAWQGEPQAVLASPAGAPILGISVNGDRLEHAWFGSVPLKTLCTDEAAQAFAHERGRGGLGLIALKNSVTFSNVRFLARSRQ
jgi:hypothetical protein